MKRDSTASSGLSSKGFRGKSFKSRETISDTDSDGDTPPPGHPGSDSTPACTSSGWIAEPIDRAPESKEPKSPGDPLPRISPIPFRPLSPLPPTPPQMPPRPTGEGTEGPTDRSQFAEVFDALDELDLSEFGNLIFLFHI